MDATLLTLALIGVAVGVNNMAAAIALGALGQAERQWRIAGTFGAFEFVLPLAGILAGREVAGLAEDGARWVAPAVIGAVGVFSVREAIFDPRGAERLAARVTSRRGLAALAFVLSMESLVIGFGMGVRGNSPLLVAGTMGVASFVFTLAGLHLGGRVRNVARRWAEAGGGVLLLALAGAMVAGIA